MTRKHRAKSTVFSNPQGFTDAELATIKSKAPTVKSYWSTKLQPDSEIISRFKSEIKDHYYYEQHRLCCYCSMELAKSKDSHDAEHIIDKGSHKNFMFEYSNLAISCKPCNRSKGTKSVLAAAGKPTNIPLSSNDYKIVHPHLDEWGEHFFYDSFDRVTPHPQSQKGDYTVKLCSIYKLNMARLADHFTKGNKQAEAFFVEFYEESSIEKKRLKLGLLQDLAAKYNLPEAVAVVDAVREEFERGLA